MHVYMIRSYYVTFEHKLELKICIVSSYFDDALTTVLGSLLYLIVQSRMLIQFTAISEWAI